MFKQYRINKLKVDIARYTALCEVMESRLNCKVPMDYIESLDHYTAKLASKKMKLELLEAL